MDTITPLTTLSRGYHRYDEPITEEYVKRRMEEAGRTLYCLPVRGVWPAQFSCSMPEIVRVNQELNTGALDGRDLLPTPTAREIDRMDETYSWIANIPVHYEGGRLCRSGGVMYRRIVLLRSLINPNTGRYVFSWTRLSNQFGAHKNSLSIWYKTGISIITKSLL